MARPTNIHYRHRMMKKYWILKKKMQLETTFQTNHTLLNKMNSSLTRKIISLFLDKLINIHCQHRMMKE